jgi:Ca2+-transporting ATPase
LKKQKPPSKTLENYFLDEKEACMLPIETLEKKLKTNLKTGLPQPEAEERLKSNGPNIIPKVKSRLIRAYLTPLLNWLITVYLIVSTILALFALFLLPQVWSQVAQWLLVIIVNIVIIVVQQVRAQSEFTSLQKLSATKSRVLRDGMLIEIASEKLVPGDIIRLVQGDRIPADARIVEASSLMVNEATLTGESNDVEKFGDETLCQDASSVFCNANVLFLGTFVTAGVATALVVETGRFTQLGKMSTKLEELNAVEMPLRQRLNKLAKYLSIIILMYLSISITYNITRLYVTNSISNTTIVAKVITRSLTTALSIMPINIPLLVTIVMLTGALAMAQHKVITRNLNSIETLGRVSVVCTDKTGTITQNHMTTKWIYIPTKQTTQLYYATGTDLKPQDKIISVYSYQSIENALENQQDYQNEKPTTIAPETPLEYLLISAILNNDSVIVEEKKDQGQKRPNWAVTGDATDTALAFLFKKSHLQEQTYRSRFKSVKKWPFDSKVKRMTTVFKDTQNNQYIFFTKGATEILLTNSSCVLNEKGEVQALTQTDKEEVEEKVELFSRLGQRVISFAFRKIDKFNPEEKRESAEKDLIYLGFVAITDPPREGVRESVTELKDAGVTPIMITGDSAATAESLAREVGIMEEGNLIAEGSAVQGLSDEDFQRTSVFARISPEDKMAIVARYKKQRCVVAMTGDGVNDAQAILTADVGIAMGAGGTDVARQAADIVLADNSFNSVVTGIREGRGVFEKIQNVVFFYIAVNLAEAMVYFGSSFIPGFFLLNTWQQIYIFATAHSVPPFALVIDRLNKDAMKEKPRNNEDLVSGHRKTALVIFALSLAIMLSVSYILPFNGVLPVFDGNKVGFTPNLSQTNQLDSVSWAHAKARTMLQSVALVAECTLILSLRRIKKPIHKSLREEANWVIWPLILAIPILHALLMYLPATQLFLMSFGVNFEIIQLTAIDWIIVLALGLTPIALLELSKVWSLKKKL